MEKFEKIIEMIASVECNAANKTMKYLMVLSTEIRKEFTAKKNAKQ